MDGLNGFDVCPSLVKDAIQSIFPKSKIQRCVIYQIRQSLKYITWKDRKAFTKDLKTIYRAATREEAEANLVRLGETWGGKCAAAVRSWETN